MPKRVLVVEDTTTQRKLIVAILDEHPDLEVVGEATDGQQAIELAGQLKPDVITMDVRMPRVDGLQATRRIMAARPTPIVVISATDPNDVALSVEAMAAGALAVLGKPPGPANPDFRRVADEIRRTVRAIADVRPATAAPGPPAAGAVSPVRRRTPTRSSAAAPRPAVARRPLPSRDRPEATSTRTPPARRAVSGASPRNRPPGTSGQARTAPASAPSSATGRRSPARPRRTPATVKVVAVGSSTGGPQALGELLGSLGTGLPCGVLIVQHIVAGFQDGMARWLDGVSDLDIAVAHGGETPRPGQVLLAPGDGHLVVDRGGRVRIDPGEPVGGHRPSIDVLFDSVARVHGPDAVGVILTGMGSDGANGLLAMRNAGAHTIGQDEASSVVYGMPKEAFRLGAVAEQAPLNRIAAAIRRACLR